MPNQTAPVLKTELEALRLAARTLDEKIDKLVLDQGYSATEDNRKGQIVRNYEKAFDLIMALIEARDA